MAADEQPAQFVDGVLVRLTLIGALLPGHCVCCAGGADLGRSARLSGRRALLITTLVAIGVLADRRATPPQRRAGSLKRRP